MSYQPSTIGPADGPAACPHIGKLINGHLKKKRILKAALSRKMGLDSSVIGRRMRCKTLQADTLWQTCHALGYNFFAELGALLPQEYESETLQKMRAELEEVKKERDLLKGILMGR